jgi:hypothetical protein
VNQEEPRAVTDVKHIYADDTNILAYRIGILETDIQGIDRKLDSFITMYPTKDILELILKPLRDDVNKLNIEKEKEAAEKAKNATQMKLLTYAAIIGPLGTFIITIVMAGLFGFLPNATQ